MLYYVLYLLCCAAAGAAIISDEWQRSLQESVDNSRHLIQTLKKKCLKQKVLILTSTLLLVVIGIMNIWRNLYEEGGAPKL